MNRGIEVLQTSALPLGYVAAGAGDEARTRYLHLGKVALYQMSYARKLQCFQWFSRCRTFYDCEFYAVLVCN